MEIKIPLQKMKIKARKMQHFHCKKGLATENNGQQLSAFLSREIKGSIGF